jgi:hypothetical protein
LALLGVVLLAGPGATAARSTAAAGRRSQKRELQQGAEGHKAFQDKLKELQQQQDPQQVELRLQVGWGLEPTQRECKQAKPAARHAKASTPPASLPQAQSGLARAQELALHDLAGGHPGFDAAAAASSPVGQALANMAAAGQDVRKLLPQLAPLLQYKHHLPAQDLER